MWVKKDYRDGRDNRLIHARVGGLIKVMKRWRTEKKLSPEELGRINYLIRRFESILAEDGADTSVAKPHGAGAYDAVSHDVKSSAGSDTECWIEPIPDSECEFYKIDDHSITCDIGHNMYQCSKQCLYSTNNPFGIPPYGSKYMKGRL